MACLYVWALFARIEMLLVYVSECLSWAFGGGGGVQGNVDSQCCSTHLSTLEKRHVSKPLPTLLTAFSEDVGACAT